MGDAAPEAPQPTSEWRPPTEPDPDPAPVEPTPTVGHDAQTKSHPAGSAMPEGGISATERPEVLVGAAFAGGFLAALILKRLGR
jgi:hypothetical protein